MRDPLGDLMKVAAVDFEMMNRNALSVATSVSKACADAAVAPLRALQALASGAGYYTSKTPSSQLKAWNIFGE